MRTREILSIDLLISKLTEIHESILSAEEEYEPWIRSANEHHRNGALNFVRYLKLRTFDLRPLQGSLSALGLSSLSHAERQVLANVENLLYNLLSLKGQVFSGKYAFGNHPLNFIESEAKLRKHSRQLFKMSKDKMGIMVTLPTEATEPNYVKKLLESGMNIARINCSHDSEAIWRKMADTVKQQSKELGLPCSVYSDLSGPKIRTTTIQAPKHARDKKRNARVFVGDKIFLFHEIPSEPLGKKAIRIGCSLPEIIRDTQVGEPIWFDDGKIGGVVIDKHDGYLTVEVRFAGPDGSKLKPEKGINLPETKLSLPSLTPSDRTNLKGLLEFTDILGYSFVRTVEDVRVLQSELAFYGREDMGIVLKIENREAFENLPALILQGMQSPSLGVMIARGDLAVELGADRLSEVQEEIMWLCEAAMVPNIWATQVLETLAKTGQPSRSEITDAAMSVRAECVMLNKGPYIIDALKTLQKILTRMEKHIYKKQGTMRPLQVAEHFFGKKLKQLSPNI